MSSRSTTKSQGISRFLHVSAVNVLMGCSDTASECVLVASETDGATCCIECDAYAK